MKGRGKSKDSKANPKSPSNSKSNPSVVPNGMGNAKDVTSKQTAAEKESENSDRSDRFELVRDRTGIFGKDKDKIEHPWVTCM